MNRKDLKGTDISRFTKANGRHLSSSYISRLVHGHQSYISVEHFEILVNVLAATPREQAELVKARLLDERPRWARRLVDIRIPQVDLLKGSSPPASQVCTPSNPGAP